MRKNNFKKISKGGWAIPIIAFLYVIAKKMRHGGFSFDGPSPVVLAVLAVSAFIAVIWFLTRNNSNEKDDKDNDSTEKNSKDSYSTKSDGFANSPEVESVETGYYKDWKEGFAFDTVKIGKQVWMAQDLEEGGSKNPYVDLNIAIPEGWRLPFKDDFIDLEAYLKKQFYSDSEIAHFLEKNWYRKPLPDDTCTNCGGCGSIESPAGGVLECGECGGTGIISNGSVSELFWTNDEKGHTPVCAYLQKSCFGFCTVGEDSVVHLRLIKIDENDVFYKAGDFLGKHL